MLNQVVLVGRIASELEEICDCGAGEVMLSIPSKEKNEDGVYDTNLIPVTLPKPIFDNAKEYCKDGDIVGVKGRIEGNGDVFWIIGEKLTFLSSRKED